jgi:hypothetical protein
MSKTDIYIVVEGQTEQTFVRDVLAPWISGRGIFLYPVLIGKPGHKGGAICFDRAKGDIKNFLRQRGNIYISTMFDYFRIDSDWPGKTDVEKQLQNGTALTIIQKVKTLEDATRAKIAEELPECNAERRFIPYIEMHDFEALLFSNAEVLAAKLGIDAATIKEILRKYPDGPEAINDDPTKAPSKRLEALKAGYRKVVMGKTISEAIGIQTMREKCIHFNDWLTKLENLK